MKKLLLVCLVAVCTIVKTNAQQANPIPFEGHVTDSAGKPLAGVSVRESNKNATTTDESGHFLLRVKSSNATVEVSYVGYVNQRIKYSGTAIHVAMKPNSRALEEVVVVGAQIQNKRTTTTAQSSITGKMIENMPAPSVDVLLQGRISGLNVQVSSGEPGVAPTVVVRGNSRVNTNIGGSANVAQAQAMSGPLYVIDGIPVNPEDIANSIDATGTNYLAGININDIETVDVQKDAAATAAWGSRGANGVIYIKTRRGRSSTPEFRVNAYFGVTQKPALLKTYTGAEERALKMHIIHQYATPRQLSALPQILTDSLNPNFNNATNWQGLFYKNGLVRNVDATVSAANDVVNYRLSMNYYNEDGIIKQFGYKRYSMRGNFDFKISPKFNAQLIVSMAKDDRQRGAKYKDNSDDNTPFSNTGNAPQPASFYLLNGFDSSNFTGLASKLRNKNTSDYYTASVTANYSILPGLRYTFQGALNSTSSNKDYFRPSNLDAVAASVSGAAAQPSYALSDRGNYSTYFLSNALNYTKKFNTEAGNTHNFVLTAAQQFTSDVSSGNSVSGYNVPSNDIQVVTGIPQSDLGGSSYYLKDALLSYMAQLQYDYNSRYLLYASYRRDASSRFGNDSKWGAFPAVGAGWIVSDEGFMKELKRRDIVNFLKIRGSWGLSGSQSSNFYAPYNSYSVSGTYNGAAAIQPSYTNGLTKNDLTWARSEQKNIGIDLQLLNSRLNINADIYDKISKDDYYNFVLPFYTGFQQINFNAHDLWVSNRGLDLSINTHNLSPRNKFQWNSQLVLSFNKNAIAKLPNNNRTFVTDDYYGVSRIYAVGQPIYQMFQMQYMGVYNKNSEIPFNPLTGNKITYFKGYNTVQPGYPIWKDANGDGDVWSGEDNGDQYGDRVPTGNPNPKFTGGFTNDFTYKNFSLSVVCTFTWKRTVINTFQQQQFDALSGNIANFAKNRLPDLDGINYWTPQGAAKDPNYKADFPAINPLAGNFYQFFPFSSMWNVDGSYFKVKYLMAGYNIPRAITSKLKVKNIRVYGLVDNVLIIKNKHNNMPDPEAVDQLGVYSGGMYPQPHKFTFGLDVQL